MGRGLSCGISDVSGIAVSSFVTCIKHKNISWVGDAAFLLNLCCQLCGCQGN